MINDISDLIKTSNQGDDGKLHLKFVMLFLGILKHYMI